MGIFVRIVLSLLSNQKKQNHENTVISKTHREKICHVDVFRR